ncbi:hypothetical protein AAE021_01405 [Arthrobacter citreus]|uniref:Uncharacterized protein n=1 Tax=Arthrobacter citreus TaxID=1670 RepID=A0ABZ2ZXZ2_9MICC
MGAGGTLGGALAGTLGGALACVLIGGGLLKEVGAPVGAGAPPAVGPATRAGVSIRSPEPAAAAAALP